MRVFRFCWGLPACGRMDAFTYYLSFYFILFYFYRLSILDRRPFPSPTADVLGVWLWSLLSVFSRHIFVHTYVSPCHAQRGIEGSGFAKPDPLLHVVARGKVKVFSRSSLNMCHRLRVFFGPPAHPSIRGLLVACLPRCLPAPLLTRPSCPCPTYVRCCRCR